MSLTRRQKLFVTDLDGTLLGDDDSLQTFADGWKSVGRDAFLVYSSGRLLDSIMNSIRDTCLPRPDLVVGGVGTEILDLRDHRRLDEWHAEFTDWDADAVRRLINSQKELELQPEEFLSPWKVSCFAVNRTASDLARLRQQLKGIGVSCRVIYSSNRDLDILPSRAGKGSAARFVARRFQVEPRNVVSAGDSGNDVCLLKATGSGIVVANAQPELHQLRTPRIFHATLPYAAGVMQGLTHWWRCRW